jgi:hypothetical protein
MKTAQIGSISHGTLRTPDLLRAFAASFEGLCDGQTIPPIVAEARGTAELIEECEERCSGQGNTATNAEALGEQEEIGQEVLTDLADNYCRSVRRHIATLAPTMATAATLVSGFRQTHSRMLAAMVKS